MSKLTGSLQQQSTLTGNVTKIGSLYGQFSNVRVQGGVTITDDGNGNITLNGVSVTNNNGNVTIA